MFKFILIYFLFIQAFFVNIIHAGVFYDLDDDKHKFYRKKQEKEKPVPIEPAKFLCPSCTFSHCVVTPKTYTDIGPDSFRTYNDLNRAEGEFANEYAHNIIIRGLVVDKNCIPVSDANIEIWQDDEYGETRYIAGVAYPYRKYQMNYKMCREVHGFGKTYSTNEGRFMFITVPPKEVTISSRKYINIAVNHPDFPRFHGKIMLTQQKTPHTAKNHFIPAQLNTDASTCYGTAIYDFHIVLSRANKYRRY